MQWVVCQTVYIHSNRDINGSPSTVTLSNSQVKNHGLIIQTI